MLADARQRKPETKNDWIHLDSLVNLSQRQRLKPLAQG